jgi:sugar phosphate isomerase/epimerase
VRKVRVHLGLHTASAVNVAEVAPYVADAVEHYLEAYVEIAPRLGAEWIVMHAGFHFTSDKEQRMAVGRDRLKRIASHAEQHGAVVLLENLNKEPDNAEIHYLAHTVEEWRYYFDAIRSPAFKLSFTVNHAHLIPEGIAGFVDALDMSRVEEVRLADCFRNGHEVHLKPVPAISTSLTCSSGSRAKASMATTRMPSARSTTCSPAETSS